MNNYHFGNYICDLREKKGLSQSQLGEKLGVSNKAVSKWENGGAYPSSELMLPLAKELGVSIEELYTALSNSKKEKNALRKFLDILVSKSTIIIVAYALFAAVLWTLFLLFGDDPEKTKILILAPVIAVILYGFVRLLFFIFKKNPMAPDIYIDLISIALLAVSVLSLGTFLLNFIVYFPNGFSPSIGAELGLITGILHANKNRM